MLSLRLALHNLSKKKDTCIVLTLFILLAVLFFDIGLSSSKEADTLFYQKTISLNSPHFIVPCDSKTYRSEYETFIQNAADLAEFKKEEAVFMPTTKNNCNDLKLGALISFIKEQQLAFTEQDFSVPAQNAIYLPMQLKSENVVLGGDYKLIYKGQTYSFTVAGFFESTYYCNTSSGFYRYYVPENTFVTLSENVGKAYLLSARMNGTEAQIVQRTKALKTSFLRETTYSTDQSNVLQAALSYDDMKKSATGNIMVGISIIFAISFLICLVVLFIIANHVREEIDKSMTAIGSLQSMGYTIKQIMLSFIFEYGILGLIGSVLGVALSYVSVFLLTPYLSGFCGYAWENLFHPAADLFSVLCVLGIIFFISTISVFRLRQLTPVAALNRLGNENIRKISFFPLQKGSLPLNLHLAVKNIFIYMKTNLVYMMIVAIGSFAIGTTLILFLNFSANSDALLSVVGYELPDLQITVNEGCNIDDFSNTLLSYEEVRKVNESSSGNYLSYNHEAVTTFVIQDFEKMEVVTPESGSYPVAPNEVMISSALSKASGKKTGDFITFEANDCEQEYLICGIFSSTNGNVAFLNLSGIRLFYPDFSFRIIDLYLEPDILSEDFRNFLQTTYKVSVDYTSSSVAEQKIAALLADYGITSASYSVWKDGVEIFHGDSSAFCIADIQDMKSFASAQIASYADSLKTIVLIVFVTMLIIMSFVLLITLKNEIRKCQKEYGILKALGYTTKDIILQVSLRFFITTLLGCLIGFICALLCAPHLFLSLFLMMGVTQIHINSYPSILLLSGALLSILLYLLTLLSCRRIRKISAYELLTE